MMSIIPKHNKFEVITKELVIIFLAACFTLAYEVLLFQYLLYLGDYTRAMLTIGLALVGLTVGSVLPLTKWHRDINWKINSSIGLTISYPIAILTTCYLSDRVFYFPVFLMLPYVFVGWILAGQLLSMKSKVMVFCDLCGAGIGAVLVALLTIYIRIESVLILLIILPLLIVFLVIKQTHLKGSCCLIFLIFILLVMSFANESKPIFRFMLHTCVGIDETKSFTSFHKNEDAYFIAGDSGLAGIIDVVRSKYSERASVSINGHVIDGLNPFTHQDSRLDFDRRLPIDYFLGSDVLVIGSSAEGVIKTVKRLNGKQRIGVEINPKTVALMKGVLRAYSGGAYDDFDIRVGDGRSFIHGNTNRFDLITFLNTHRSPGIGYIGGPEYLYTVEAFKVFFEHLNPKGVLLFEEVERQSGRDNPRALPAIKRVLITLAAALHEMGGKDIGKHFYLYGWKKTAWDYFTILCSRTPFTREDESKLDEWREKLTKARGRKLYKIHSPNGLIKSSYASLFEKQGLVEQNYKIIPATDDNPYVQVVYKFEKALFFKLLVPILIILVVGIVALSLFTTALSKLSNQKFVTMQPISMAGILGLAYLLYESYLVQKLDLLLGNPTLALAVTLGGILFFSGIGALYIEQPYNRFALKKSILVAALLIIVELVIIQWIIAQFLSFDILARSLIALLLVAIPGFFMGRPLPTLLSMFDNEPTLTKYRTIMFGVNSMFGVLGMALAFFIGAQVSLSFVAYLSIVSYLLAIILTRGLPDARAN